MFRVIFGIIVSLFMVSLLRMIMSAITREVTPQKQQPQQQPRGAASAPTTAPTGGNELRKCPMCGAYHAMTAVAGRTKTGEIVHFCSVACREKFAAA